MQMNFYTEDMPLKRAEKGFLNFINITKIIQSFCKPIFKDFDFNKLIQNNGEKKAELYYKNNYQQAKSLDNAKDNGFEESDSDSSSDSENNIKFKKDGKNI